MDESYHMTVFVPQGLQLQFSQPQSLHQSGTLSSASSVSGHPKVDSAPSSSLGAIPKLPKDKGQGINV